MNKTVEFLEKKVKNFQDELRELMLDDHRILEEDSHRAENLREMIRLVYTIIEFIKNEK